MVRAIEHTRLDIADVNTILKVVDRDTIRDYIRKQALSDQVISFTHDDSITLNDMEKEYGLYRYKITQAREQHVGDVPLEDLVLSYYIWKHLTKFDCAHMYPNMVIFPGILRVYIHDIDQTEVFVCMQDPAFKTTFYTTAFMIDTLYASVYEYLEYKKNHKEE